MIRKIFIFLSICYFCINCSSKNSDNFVKKKDVRIPEEIYVSAKNKFDSGDYILAREEFNELIKLYPLSNESIQGEIMIGFISYIEMEYDDAIIQFKKIANKYPAHKNLDYVFFMIAMCNYEQITHEGLDGNFTNLALKDFNQVITRFPNSKYAKDSNQKIILVKSNQAAKHMEIGRFYLKQKKYIAALNRFKIVIQDYSMTKFVPEALHRMVETYYAIGMDEESIITASTLGYNYPNSKWYKYSYKLIKNNADEKNLLIKLKSFFDGS